MRKFDNLGSISASRNPIAKHLPNHKTQLINIARFCRFNTCLYMLIMYCLIHCKMPFFRQPPKNFDQEIWTFSQNFHANALHFIKRTACCIIVLLSN